jgi:phage tail-like protein
VNELLRAFRFEVALTLSKAGAGGEARPAFALGVDLQNLDVDRAKRRKAKELLGDGAFQECSGLELEADVREYLEGGRNDGVIRRVGRVKLSPLVLKRGMFAPDREGYANTELWSWFQDVVRGVRPVRRYDGTIIVRTVSGDTPMAVWRFVRGLPLKVTGPTLNAQTGEVAIEELHIAHEGLLLEPTQPGGALRSTSGGTS